MYWMSFAFFQLLGAALGGWLYTNWMAAGVGALAGAWLWWLLYAWQSARFYRWAKDEGQTQRRFWGLWANLQYFWRKQQRKFQFREDRQAKNLQEVRLAIQASPNGVMMLDQDWAIEWLNNMASEHFGLDEARDLGQNLLTLVRDPEFGSYCAVGDFRQTLEMDSGFLAAGSGIGRRRLAVQVFPYGDDKRLLLSRDVTHFQRAELMRRDFIANVSHEIRTPLTIFSGYVETLQTLPLGEADRDKYYRRMQQQASRMQVLVEDLLTLSTLEGSPLPNLSEFIDVHNLMVRCRDEAEALSASLAPDTSDPVHRLSLHYEDALNQAVKQNDVGVASAIAASAVATGPASEEGGDAPSDGQSDNALPRNMGRLAGAEKEIYSAFSNLVANAIRYTPAGGEVRLMWRWHTDGSAAFTVQDTGPGIAAEHIPRLTERFYRVDRSRSRETGGTGLGLAIVKHVAQRHGGHLEISSTVGKGSSFCVELPASRLQTPQAVMVLEQERLRRERMLQS